jgi:hypothetical protein
MNNERTTDRGYLFINGLYVYPDQDTIGMCFGCIVRNADQGHYITSQHLEIETIYDTETHKYSYIAMYNEI